MVTGTKVSLRPSDFVEGGAVPVDRNLVWKECRFVLFDYTRKTGEVVATTTAARIKYEDDHGGTYEQHYSAADPERFVPSDDGKRLVPVGSGAALSTSSNFYVLVNALINAGFPEDKIDDELSSLDGLYTHNIGVPEPKRSGLVRATPAEGARERILSVPSQILRLPWEGKKGAKAAAPAKGKAAPAAVEAEDATDAAVAIVTAMLAESESVTRQQVATKAIRDKQAGVARLVFQPEFQVALLANGMQLEGEDISRS